MIKQSGVALVLVLWVLSLLIIMAGSFSLTMRREASITSVIKNNAEAKAIADSGIAIAEMMLINTDPNKIWLADGSIYEVLANQAKIRIRIESEAGKIDLNRADQRLLQMLMINAPVDEEQQVKLVGAILDWRDSDELANLNGAEKADYEAAGLSYEPRNKPFESVEELQLVLGFDKDIFMWIEPLVTVYSKLPQVNFQVASKEVLQAVSGLDSDLIESYVLSRIDSARNGFPMPILPPMPGIRSAVAAKSNAVTITSESFLSKDSRATISVILKRSETNEAGPFQVMKWQHAQTNNKSLFSEKMSELLVKQYAEPELNN